MTAVGIEVKGLERCLGKYLADHDIYRGLHGHLCKFDIQYNEGWSYSPSFIERPKEDKTISSFDSVVAVYVELYCEISKP